MTEKMPASHAAFVRWVMKEAKRREPRLLVEKRSSVVGGRWDFICVANGRHGELELKVGRDKLSLQQKLWGARLTLAGAYWLVARTRTEVLKFFDRLIGEEKETI